MVRLVHEKVSLEIALCKKFYQQSEFEGQISKRFCIYTIFIAFGIRMRVSS